MQCVGGNDALWCKKGSILLRNRFYENITFGVGQASVYFLFDSTLQWNEDIAYDEIRHKLAWN